MAKYKATGTGVAVFGHLAVILLAVTVVKVMVPGRSGVSWLAVGASAAGTAIAVILFIREIRALRRERSLHRELQVLYMPMGFREWWRRIFPRK